MTERKLAVIFHADVVGSTKLVQLNEAVAHDRIQEAFRRLSETINSYGGIAHEIRGDAIVAEFARASDAVNASISFQEVNAVHNETLSGEIRPIVRAGIAIGEVVIADNTVTGEGVVLAQRLEQLAEPGGVCISGAIHEALPQHMPFDQENLGEQKVKGFDESVKVYSVRLSPGSIVPKPEKQTNPVASALTLPDKPSIAILPFTNLSGDPERQYFSDGFSEEIINGLTHIRSFKVVARNSSFAFRDSTLNARDIGKELSCRYLVNGSLRKADKRVRVAVHLIDTESDSQIWSDQYEGTLDDIFDLQDKVTAAVVGAIEPKIRVAEIEKTKAKRIENLDAYDCYLKALSLVYVLSFESTNDALALLKKALELDPDFNRAQSLAAWCYTLRPSQGWVAKDDEEAVEAVRLAYKALQGEPDNPEVLWQSGYTIWFFSDQLYEGIVHIEHALTLNPNSAQAWVAIGLARLFSGDAPTALKHFQKALELSPSDPIAFRPMTGTAIAHYFLGDDEKSIEWSKKAHALKPNHIDTLRFLAAALVRVGKQEEAEKVMSKVSAILPGSSIELFKTHTPVKDQKYLDHIVEGLRKAGMREHIHKQK